MKTAFAKAPKWPKIIRNGSVIIKIYRVENKGRESLTLSYHAADKRVLKMFASLDKAVAEGICHSIRISTAPDPARPQATGHPPRNENSAGLSLGRGGELLANAYG